MKQQEQLDIALIHINELLKLTSTNQYNKFIRNHLIPVKYELQRQQQKLIIRHSNSIVSAE